MNLLNIHKTHNRLNLKDLPTLITDTSRDSYNYFVISDLPAILPAGKSCFKLSGNPNTLKLFTEVQIEVYDINNALIYSEFNTYVDETDRRYATIYVYPDTPSGIATICVTGVAAKYLKDGVFINVPNEWKNVVNLKWIYQVQVAADKPNTSDIIFDTFNLKSLGAPIVSISELYTNVPTKTSESIATVAYTGSIKYYSSIDNSAVAKQYITTPANIDISQIDNDIVTQKQTNTGTKGDITGSYIDKSNTNINSGITQQVVNPYFVASNISDDDISTVTKFPSDINISYIVDPTKIVNDEGLYSQKSITTSVITIANTGSFTFNEKHIGGRLHINKGDLTFVSPSINVSGSALLSVRPEYYESVILKILSNSKVLVTSPYIVTCIDKNTHDVTDNTITNFSATKFSLQYIEPSLYAQSQVYKSYALVEIGNINTIAGSVDSVNIFHKSQAATSGDYQLLSKYLLKNSNFLIDTSVAYNLVNIGNFTSQSIIDSYWKITNYGTQTSQLIQQTNGVVYNAMLISGSKTQQTEYSVVEPKTFRNKFYKNCNYEITADLNITANSINKAVMYVYMSGSAFQGETLISKIDLVLPAYSSTYMPNISIPFYPKYIGYGAIKLEIYSGDWAISNLQIKSYYETGFNPAHVKFALPVNPLWADDILDFKFEFLNSNGKSANKNLLIKNISFLNPAPTVVQGPHNLISGSMYIGNALGSGIEIAGVNSGYIRSIGYEGFTSASNETGAPGFMMWSGSVLPNSGENYTGVGLELASRDGSFKFRTDPSVFEVITKNFFVGTSSLNFVSGSGGQLEISSSEFWLQPNGHVIIGGGAEISGTLSVDHIQVPVGGPYKAEITSDGRAFFSSASIGGWNISANEIYNVSASKYTGLTVAGNTRFFAGASSLSNSGSAIFNVKTNGDVTGSSVLFTGGKIGGFIIGTNVLSSSNGNLILKDTGEITGSTVLFTGGKIGGFVITATQFTGANILLDSSGIIQTSNFVSGLKGWKISSEGNGTAEFENARIRGTLKTVVFEKETVNAVGGQLWVANSTTITGSITAAATQIPVKNASSWTNGEIILIKKLSNTGFSTEYCKVYSSSLNVNTGSEPNNIPGILYVTRSYGSGTSGSYKFLDGFGVSQSYEDGQAIVSTGRLSTGFIKLNSNPSDVNTPFIDIVERTGSGIYDVDLVARLGDLSGIANYKSIVPATPGYGLYSDNVYLQGKIIAQSGQIAGLIITGSKIYVGAGNFNNADTSLFISSSGKFSLKDQFVWDGSTLSITGSINISNDIPVSQFVNDLSWSIATPRADLLSQYSWSLSLQPMSADSASGYTLYGSASKNEISYAIDPFNRTSLVWKCLPWDDALTLDGGWNNTPNTTYNKNKGYRYSVWIYKSGSLTDGITYVAGAHTSMCTITTGLVTTPYFFNGDLPSLNKWYLAVGYVWPYDYGTTQNNIGGLYDSVTGQKVTNFTDYKWANPPTSVVTGSFRTFLNSATLDSASCQQWMFGPALYELNGSEPSINQLLGKDYLTYNSASAGIASASEASSSAAAAQYTASLASSSLMNNSTGLLVKNPTPSGNGLYLGASNLGYYSASVWRTYMSSSGNFYLTSSVGYLQWDASTGNLSIKGDIIITNPTTAIPNLLTNVSGALYTASNASASAYNAQFTASQVSGAVSYITTSLIYNDPTGRLNKTPTVGAVAGLYLGTNNLGYYNGTKWTTYMSNSGDFYLTGSNGYLLWDNASSTLAIKGTITASAGLIGGLNIGANSIYVGTGTYGNTNTPLYFQSAGSMSLSDKFKWDGTRLMISASEFVLGNKALQFVSGAAGKIEISSSNFWIKNTGDVIMRNAEVRDNTNLYGNLYVQGAGIAGAGMQNVLTGSGNVMFWVNALNATEEAHQTSNMFITNDGTIYSHRYISGATGSTAVNVKRSFLNLTEDVLTVRWTSGSVYVTASQNRTVDYVKLGINYFSIQYDDITPPEFTSTAAGGLTLSRLTTDTDPADLLVFREPSSSIVYTSDGIYNNYARSSSIYYTLKKYTEVGPSAASNVIWPMMTFPIRSEYDYFDLINHGLTTTGAITSSYVSTSYISTRNIKNDTVYGMQQLVMYPTPNATGYPTGFTTGSFYYNVSGSVEQLRVFNGTIWKTVTLT